MTKSIKIAVDAMGGDNSPKKIIEGIEIYYNENQDVFYNIFGDKNVIEKLILNKSIKRENYELIHTEEKIEGEYEIDFCPHRSLENKKRGSVFSRGRLRPYSAFV